jgi:hypothetical protein
LACVKWPEADTLDGINFEKGDNLPVLRLDFSLKTSAPAVERHRSMPDLSYDINIETGTVRDVRPLFYLYAKTPSGKKKLEVIQKSRLQQMQELARLLHEEPNRLAFMDALRRLDMGNGVMK